MVSEALPRLISPLLQNAPDMVSANNSLANIDLFDGFGNAGMAQPPPQMQFVLEDEQFSLGDYDRKFPMASNSPDSSGNASCGGNNPQVQGTPPDMAPPSFTTSPPLMSPGVDFAPNMNDFSAFPDMMMQRMGQTSGPGAMHGTQTAHQQQHCSMPPAIQGQNLCQQVVHGAGPAQGQSPGGGGGGGLGVSPGQGLPNGPRGVTNGQSPGMSNHPPQQQAAMMGHQNKGLAGEMRGGMHGMHSGGGNMAAQLQRSGSFVGPHRGQGVMARTVGVGDYHALQRVRRFSRLGTQSNDSRDIAS